MRPTVDAGALRRTRASEHLARFAFGGGLTAAAGLVAHSWGPALGGLLLGVTLGVAAATWLAGAVGLWGVLHGRRGP